MVFQAGQVRRRPHVKGDVGVSNIPDIKQRLDRLTQLGNSMKDNLTRLKGAEGEELKKEAKKEGTRLGIGIGISLLGLIVAAVAGLYVLAVIILLVNIALDKPWLSALIVVGGFIIIGGIVLAAGVAMAAKSGKKLSKATEEKTAQIKKTGEEIKAEIDELQQVLKKESEVRQKQVKETVETLKASAPVTVPAVAVGLLVLKLIKRHHLNRKENKRILKVIEMFEESKAQE
jgi:hypothetical protein